MAEEFARFIIWFCIVLFAQGRRHLYKDNFFSNSWVVYTSKGSIYVEELSKRHGFLNRGQVGSLEGFYVLEHRGYSKRLRRSLDSHTTRFLRDPHIKYARQQKILRRSKRDFSDPLYTIQWYLNNTGRQQRSCKNLNACGSKYSKCVFKLNPLAFSSYLVSKRGTKLSVAVEYARPL